MRHNKQAVSIIHFEKYSHMQTQNVLKIKIGTLLL